MMKNGAGGAYNKQNMEKINVHKICVGSLQ